MQIEGGPISLFWLVFLYITHDIHIFYFAYGNTWVYTDVNIREKYFFKKITQWFAFICPDIYALMSHNPI